MHPPRIVACTYHAASCQLLEAHVVVERGEQLLLTLKQGVLGDVNHLPQPPRCVVVGGWEENLARGQRDMLRGDEAGNTTGTGKKDRTTRGCEPLIGDLGASEAAHGGQQQ